MLFELLGNFIMVSGFVGVLLIGTYEFAKKNNRTIWEELLDEN